MGYCNKVRYPDKLSARIAAAQLSQKTGDRFRAYYCEIHNGWHLTTKKAGRYAKKVRASKSVSYRKRAVLEATQEDEFRQVRNLRQWEADESRQDSGISVVAREIPGGTTCQDGRN